MPIAVALLSAGNKVSSLNEILNAHKTAISAPNFAIKVIFGIKKSTALIYFYSQLPPKLFIRDCGINKVLLSIAKIKKHPRKTKLNAV